MHKQFLRVADREHLLKSGGRLGAEGFELLLNFLVMLQPDLGQLLLQQARMLGAQHLDFQLQAIGTVCAIARQLLLQARGVPSAGLCEGLLQLPRVVVRRIPNDVLHLGTHSVLSKEVVHRAQERV